MIKFIKNLLFFFILSVLFVACKNDKEKQQKSNTEIKILPPEELYGDLFYDVQQNVNLFSDSKTFVDAIPKKSLGIIQSEYEKIKNEDDTVILQFLKKNFKLPNEQNLQEYKTDSSSIGLHIKKLWAVLKKPADPKITGTLIPLPHPYIVPGGRFREIYYWDSYFTMLGLQVDGEIEIMQHMIDNFSYLINEYGFIPNGNRTYYLSRSQPPFYALMIDLIAETKGDSIYTKYLPELEKEYRFWMEGKEQLSENDSVIKRVIRLSDGSILNRYYDNKNTPRPESYREDVKTAETALKKHDSLTKEEVYRHLRAAAESGWDFSSRWIKPKTDGSFDLSNIQTTHILPIDLNCLLYHLEKTLAKAYMIYNKPNEAKKYQSLAQRRAEAIARYFWDASSSFYRDYNFIEARQTSVISAAGIYPLFFKIASEEKAEKLAKVVRSQLLKEGGLVSTTKYSGEQWDAPNAWAPLQWIAYKGLLNYGILDLANSIKKRWLMLNEKVYKNTYKMTEKYNVEDLSKESGGGEYPTQDGFGWTNGVYKKLTSE